MRILREVTTVALGVHFALIRRDVHELLALSPTLSRLLYAMADFISDHQLILDQDSRSKYPPAEPGALVCEPLKATRLPTSSWMTINQ